MSARHFAFRRSRRWRSATELTHCGTAPFFFNLFEERFLAAHRAHNDIALIAIDLDRFKDINDTLGHPVGDAVLQEVADRLRSGFAPATNIAKIGGDEFLVMFGGFAARRSR